MSPMAQSIESNTDNVLQKAFLAIVPRIERHARIYFRDFPCPATPEDAVTETVALAWSWYRRLMRRGRDAAHFASQAGRVCRPRR